jgi:hypothetical protein
VAVALLDTPSLLEGAFLLPGHKTLLLSDTCIMVRLVLWLSLLQACMLTSSMTVSGGMQQPLQLSQSAVRGCSGRPFVS